MRATVARVRGVRLMPHAPRAVGAASCALEAPSLESCGRAPAHPATRRAALSSPSSPSPLECEPIHPPLNHVVPLLDRRINQHLKEGSERRVSTGSTDGPAAAVEEGLQPLHHRKHVGLTLGPALELACGHFADYLGRVPVSVPHRHWLPMLVGMEGAEVDMRLGEPRRISANLGESRRISARLAERLLLLLVPHTEHLCLVL